MPTNRVNLSTTNYVRINIGYGPLIVESLTGDIHVALSETKPAVTNIAFHKLTDRNRLTFDRLDTNVWVLGKNTGAQAVVTEVTSAAGSILPIGVTGAGDLIADAWGIQKVSTALSLFHSLFTNEVNQAWWLKYHNGTETQATTNVYAEDAQMTLLTDDTVTDVIVESRETPRYQPNRGHLFSTSIRCPDPTALCEREWGLGFRAENEVVFRLKPDGNLYAVIVSGGTQRTEELIDTSVLTGFDVSKNNIYDIQFQWRGAGNYKFYIGNPATGLLTLVHQIDYLGTLERLTMENPALPAHFQNTSLTEHAALYCGCVDITSENGVKDRLLYGASYAENVSVNGTDSPVMAIYQPPTIGTNINTDTVSLARISVNCDKKSAFKVWLTRDPTAFTGATFADINSGSHVQTDSTDVNPAAARTTAFDTTKARLITAIPVLAAVPRQIDNPARDEIIFPIVRGDYLMITCTSTNSVADALIEWGEAVS